MIPPTTLTLSKNKEGRLCFHFIEYTSKTVIKFSLSLNDAVKLGYRLQTIDSDHELRSMGLELKGGIVEEEIA